LLRLSYGNNNNKKEKENKKMFWSTAVMAAVRF
jgi:hypothetical protein